MIYDTCCGRGAVGKWVVKCTQQKLYAWQKTRVMGSEVDQLAGDERSNGGCDGIS